MVLAVKNGTFFKGTTEKEKVELQIGMYIFLFFFLMTIASLLDLNLSCPTLYGVR